MRVLFIAIAILSLPACSGMLLGTNSPGEATAPDRDQSSSGANADTAISGSLRRQYSSDSEISQYAIGIRSSNGRVILTGIVGTYSIRDRIVDIAQNTHGVVTVDSRVVVNTNL